MRIPPPPPLRGRPTIATKRAAKKTTQSTGAVGGFSQETIEEGALVIEPFELPKQFTKEQQAIINSDADILFGQALAGTGKSTTAIGYVAARPQEKILVLCFNTANAADARNKYPQVCSNATIRTVHALAYEKLDKQMRPRVTNRWNVMTVQQDLRFVGANPSIRLAAIAHSILTDFFNTADEKIDVLKHGITASNRYQATGKEVREAAILANKLWLAMQSPTPTVGMSTRTNPVNIPHDAYLKIFSLQNKPLGFDAIILDEAQDANAIMLHIMLQQNKLGTRLVFLGDTHQSIYDFRGAVNAMDVNKMPKTPTVLPLTESWRMGVKTASIANLLLKELKGEHLRIKASGKDESFDENAPRAFLARLNATLMEHAVELDGKGIYWVGGIEGYRVSMLEDAWNLYLGQRDKIKDPMIKRSFTDYHDLVEAARYDTELNVIQKLVDNYKGNIPKIVKNLRANAVSDEKGARFVFSTAHKSKGLEWDYVEVANDFNEPLSMAEHWLSGADEEFPEQEINLLYVCYTRAKKALKINKQTYEWLTNLEQHRSERVRRWTGQQGFEAPANTNTQANRAGTANAFAGLQAFRM